MRKPNNILTDVLIGPGPARGNVHLLTKRQLESIAKTIPNVKIWSCTYNAAQELCTYWSSASDNPWLDPNTPAFHLTPYLAELPYTIWGVLLPYSGSNDFFSLKVPCPCDSCNNVMVSETEDRFRLIEFEETL